MSGEAMPNAYRPGADLAADEAALIARREALLGPAYRLFYERPLQIVRGEGVWLYDAAGEAYLDAYNNVASVGHCHPRVVEAVARQAAQLATHTRYLHEAPLELAERLLATLPPALGHVMFTCTGSEANDLALRLAFEATGGTGVIVTENAYHGVTLALAQLSPSLGPGVPLGPHVRTVPAPDPATGGDRRLAEAVAAAAADLARHGIRPAALICDTIFSSDGVFPDPPGFLRPAAEAIRAAGGLFIADEVQPGFGRTGQAFWGFGRHGVVPDMVSMGKPMGNGYPVAALALRPELAEGFGRRGRYFNTFGGNPVAAAAALAVLEVIESEGLRQNAETVGNQFRQGLTALADGHDTLGAVRGAGLFLGLDVVDPDSGAPDPARAVRLVNRLREARILISATGAQGHVLKIRPPLCFGPAEVALFLDRLSDVLDRA